MSLLSLGVQFVHSSADAECFQIRMRTYTAQDVFHSFVVVFIYSKFIGSDIVLHTTMQLEHFLDTLKGLW